MAEIFQIQSKDVVLRIGDYDCINGTTQFNWDPVMNEEYVYEIGNEFHAASMITPEVSGSFEMNATGSTVAFLKRMIIQRDGVTSEFEGYKAQADPDNEGFINETDLEHAQFDLVTYVKGNDVFERAELLPRMFLTGLSFRADANGFATETYSFQGDLVHLYPSPRQDVHCLAVTRNVSNPTTQVDVPAGFDVEVAGGTYEADATHIISFLMIDDVVVPVSETVNGSPQTNLVADWTAGAPNTFDGTVTVSNYEVKLGARLSLVVYAATAGSFPTISYPTHARFVKASSIDLFLVDPATVDAIADGALNAYTWGTSSLFLRVQSMDINVDLQRETLRQVRKNTNGTGIYYRATTYPLNITANVSALDADAKAWYTLQGKTSTDILNLQDFEGQTWALVMVYYRGDDVMQTIVLGDARVTGRGLSLAVRGRQEVSWSFTGSKLRIEGSNTTA